MSPDALAPTIHRLSLRVYWEDTDASGIVYHASYLRFAERARTEMLRAIGFEQNRLLDDTGIAFAVRRIGIDFSGPARLDDLLEVETRVVEMSGASLTMAQDIRRDGALLTRLDVLLACIDRAGRAARIPAPIREAFATVRSGAGVAAHKASSSP